MKILYAVQGSGNGHVARSRELIPHLEKYGEVDILISGTQSHVDLPKEPKYRFKGISFYYGKGGIDIAKTMETVHFLTTFKDALQFPIDNYDLVVNDFEPVSAWAAQIKKKKIIGLSHQAAFLSDKVPRPKNKNLIAEGVLNFFAPASKHFGIYTKIHEDYIFTPVIRSEIRNLKPQDEKHITVYLPAYEDEKLIKIFSEFPNIKWEIFSKESEIESSEKNISVFPINNKKFIQSLESCAGLITNGGFESPAEAMFLGKKVLTIPQKFQYEQYCNAIAFGNLGATVVEKIDSNFPSILKTWLEKAKPVKVDFPDNAKMIIERVVEYYKENFE